jgi:hypothetical protein
METQIDGEQSAQSLPRSNLPFVSRRQISQKHRNPEKLHLASDGSRIVGERGNHQRAFESGALPCSPFSFPITWYRLHKTAHSFTIHRPPALFNALPYNTQTIHLKHVTHLFIRKSSNADIPFPLSLKTIIFSLIFHPLFHHLQRPSAGWKDQARAVRE